MESLNKLSYEGIKAGDTLILNESSLHEGRLLDRGTEFTVISFPDKVSKRDGSDKNKNGFIRDYFVYGKTNDNHSHSVRVTLNKVVKKLK